MSQPVDPIDGTPRRSKLPPSIVWQRLQAMSANADRAKSMTNAELAEALRRTVGDDIPMHDLAYDLVEQAAERLEGITIL